MAQASTLEQELSALKAKKTDRGFVLTLGDVLFATGKADLMPGAQRANDQLAAFLLKYPTRTVSVEGHTDSMGSEQYNLMLSQDRALSVRSAIMASGTTGAILLGKSRLYLKNSGFFLFVTISHLLSLSFDFFVSGHHKLRRKLTLR